MQTSNNNSFQLSILEQTMYDFWFLNKQNPVDSHFLYS